MKIIEYKDGSQEKEIVTAMIVHDGILGQIASKWGDGHKFASPYINQVGQWCVDYYAKHHKAPRRSVKTIYAEWARKKRDEDLKSLIERLLVDLSSEYEQAESDFNQGYLLELAGRHFNKVKAKNLQERLANAVELDDMEKFDRLLTEHHKIELGMGNGVYSLNDEERIAAVYDRQENQTIIEWSGALGKFFKGYFERDGFIAFQGHEKIGKSFWLIETGYQALCQRKKVGFFSVGDMADWQVERRLHTRIIGRPQQSASREWPYTVRIPTAIIKPENPDDSAQASFKEKTFKQGLNGKLAVEGIRDFMEQTIRSKRKFWKLYCCPGDTINVQGIRAILQEWALDGFIPDVLVIDYADLLATTKNASKFDKRDQINATWIALRALALELHCLVVTATQTNAKSYVTKTLTPMNFSEDKRKHSHVTGSFGLNQTPKEKEQGIMRVNCTFLRDGESHVGKWVTVAQCLPLANPCVISAF